MRNRCFEILCFFVVANELHAAPVAEPDEVPSPSLDGINASATFTPIWPSLVALAAQSNQLLDQSYQRLKEYGKNGSQYVGDKLQSGGKYLREEIDAGLKNAVSQGYNGYRYVTDNLSSGVEKGKDFVQQGTAEGLRRSVSGVGTIGDYRRAGVNNVANYAAVGALRLNEILDNLNLYLKKKLGDAANVVENPQLLPNIGG